MAVVAAVGGPCFGGGAGSRDDSSSSSGRLLKYRVERRCTTPKYAPPPPHSHSLSPGWDDGDSDWCGVGNTHTRCFPGCCCCCFLLRMNATVLCVRWGRQDTQTGGDGDGGRLSLCCVLCCGRWGRSGASLLGYSRWRGMLSHGVGSKEGAWMCSSPFLGGGGGLVHTVRSFIRCRALTAAAAGYFSSPGPCYLVQSCPVRSLHFDVGTM